MALRSWLVGLAVGAAVTALAYRFLVTDPFLLSTLAVAWVAAGVAVHGQRDALPLFERGGRWGGAFAGVTTYVAVTLQSAVDAPAGTVFVVSLTVIGLAAFGAGAGSAMTARAAE
ncbi:hypothetical protein [Haloglomus litoreum]|uniref:hypothetical protein n=1 Tax=Haloglomus litoreum TaxID=3034026 RepID=UPI0023E8A355|nr:hypothetical protein [Haloglomus sp. DT116]